MRTHSLRRAIGTALATLGLTALAVVAVPAAQASPTAGPDISVGLSTQVIVGVLSTYVDYTVTATNNGPGTASGVVVTSQLGGGLKASQVPSGCTASNGNTTVTCGGGSLAAGASESLTFRANLGLLQIGIGMPVTATRTASSPADPNPANDSATKTCTRVTILLTICS